MAMIVSITILNKSVLYYFKYLLGDAEAGQLALASMGLVSAVAVPLWMFLSRSRRAVWYPVGSWRRPGDRRFLTLFAAIDIHRAGVMRALPWSAVRR